MADFDTRALDRIPKWWPIAAAILVLTAGAVRVQASVETLNSRVSATEAQIQDVRDRLARIEERGDNTLRTVRRIEQMLDR